MKKIFFFISFLAFFYGCEKVNTHISIYTCGAENIHKDKLTDSLNQYYFESAKLRTDDFARTGKYSIKIDSINKYGFTFRLTNIKKGEYFSASVWQKKGTEDGALICSTNDGLYLRTFVGDMPTKDGWIYHNLTVYAGNDIDSITFYVFSGGKTAYFDDFKIKKSINLEPYDYDKHLELYIPDSSNKKLKSYIENSINAKTITQANKKYVNAFILKGSDSISIKMRLKGDWTDHLTSGKTSYRIKIDGNNSFWGLKTFSIQHPQTRNYMHEWFVHQLFDKEDLLSTKYDFLTVKINGVNKGVYAIEEHFDKQLLESRKRREGPIVKIDETGFWNSILMSDSLKKDSISVPYFESSYISLFKKKRTLKNKLLKQQFLEASKLLTLYKNKFEHPEQIFDLKELANFYVIHEISNAYHGLAWHNRRFYFNPITEHLEQIGYDLIPGRNNKQYLSILGSINAINNRNEHSMKKYLILNRDFKKYYMFYLKKYTRKTYFDNLFKHLNPEIKKRENLIKSEQPDFFFDTEFYYNRIDFIQNNLEDLEIAWDSVLALNENSLIPEKLNYTPNKNELYIENVSTNFYVHKIDSGIYELQMENYHLNDVTLLGYQTKRQKDAINYFEKSINLKGYNDVIYNEAKSILLNKKPNKIVFEITNNPDTIYTKKVIKWKKPQGITTRMELEQSFNPNTTYYSIKDSVLTFKQGKYQIDELLYIPKDYIVFVPNKTTIDFIKGGGLIINNSFYCEGTKANPIRFTSSDNKNNGITVLKAKEVIMKHVKADSLNTLHYKKWNLTGGITIYESEVSMLNCKINYNKCEDALNIIRSNFDIDSLFISNTFSDGFDADFCTGKITNSTFNNTGNDCIDFSGSVVEIKNINIYQSGDKGISGGERSNLSVYNIFIDGAITGIAAKDDTKIKGDNITVKNAEYGLAAFQKKAEYNKAFIELANVVYSNLNQKGLVDKGSIVKINGNFFVGTLILDIDQLYARFEK
jgi:hypothetical protein